MTDAVIILGSISDRDVAKKASGMFDKFGIEFESTVVDMTSEIPVLLRPGGIGISAIRDVIGEVAIGYLGYKR